MSGNDGQPNLPVPDDPGAPLVVAAEFTLLLRENGDAQEHIAGRFCCWHAGGFTWQLLLGSFLHGLAFGAGGNGGIGSSTPPEKRRSAGATSAADELGKSNSGSGRRDKSDVSDRRLGVAGDVVARSWEKEILGLVSSGASSIGAVRMNELSVRVSERREQWVADEKQLAGKGINREMPRFGPRGVQNSHPNF
jgi:hypothetical protein